MTSHPPSVSYVMPVLNEAARLGAAVGSVLAQEYAGEQQVVLAVGPSTDGTEQVSARLAGDDPRISVVANPTGHIPAGLNRAVREARGEVVIRVDAHTELPPRYTSTMVEVLERTGAANAGGVMRAKGSSALQRAVARAYNSPLGLGGGVYHGRGDEGPADSAYLGVFRHAVLAAVGGYDESIRRGEDYDLNRRIIAAGHRVWFVPDVEVTYWPRSTWPDLVRQMYSTGAWRGELFRRRHRTPVRYLVAPGLVAALATSSLVAAASLVVDVPPVLKATHLAPASYAAFLAYAGGWALGGERLADRTLDAGVLATMHLSWGAGFWKGLLSGAGSTVDRSRVR